MIDFKWKADGTLLIDEIKTHGNMTFSKDDPYPFSPTSFDDPDCILALISDQFVIHFENGNSVTFTDAHQLRLFLKHNRMLMMHDRKETISKIKKYIKAHPGVDDDTLFTAFMTAELFHIKMARLQIAEEDLHHA